MVSEAKHSRSFMEKATAEISISSGFSVYA